MDHAPCPARHALGRAQGGNPGPEHSISMTGARYLSPSPLRSRLASNRFLRSR